MIQLMILWLRSQPIRSYQHACRSPAKGEAAGMLFYGRMSLRRWEEAGDILVEKAQNFQYNEKRINKEEKGLESDSMAENNSVAERKSTAEQGCRLCPRNCGADRKNGQAGVCGVSGRGILCARAALHMWEEPCISGSSGSGTVFFSGCPLRCVYCQNRPIARAERGTVISVKRLAEIFLELQEQRAANINLVTPTHYTPEIIEAVKEARKNGLSVPVVYNCGGYEKAETLKMLEGIVDVYLTDFKYMEPDAAARYSGAADYPETAKAALAEMVRQTGRAVFDASGMMKRGVIVRHLLLPGHVGNAKAVVRYIYETYGDLVWISLMNQYTPLPWVRDFPELDRTVTKREYERLVDYAVSLGVENGFIQEGETAAESFIPPFDCEGLRARTETEGQNRGTRKENVDDRRKDQ